MALSVEIVIIADVLTAFGNLSEGKFYNQTILG